MLKRLTAGLLTLCMVFTFVPMSVVAEEATCSIVADMVIQNKNGTSVFTDVTNYGSVGRSGYHNYYIFNNIENGSAISVLKHIVGTTTGTSENKRITYAIQETPITSVEEFDRLYNPGELSNIINWSASYILTDSTFSGTIKSYYQYPMTNVVIPDGYTLIIRHHQANNTNLGSVGSTNYIKPQLTYNWDEASFKAEVLNKVNDATADTIEAVLRTYKNTIGIDVSKINSYNIEAYKTALVTNRPTDGFASLADVQTAYNGAVTDETVLDTINTATEENLIGILNEYSEYLQLDTYYINEYTTADLAAALISRNFESLDEVKAAYESTYSEAAVLEKINLTDTAGLEKVLTFYVNVIGIDLSKLDSKTLPYLQPALVGKSFANMTAVRKAFNKAVEDNFVSSVIADITADYNKSNSTWTDLTASCSDNRPRLNKKVFYVFNRVEYGSLMQNLKFRVGTNTESELKGITYYIINDDVNYNYLVEKGLSLTASGTKSGSAKKDVYAETTNKLVYEYSLSNVSIAEGQTLVIMLENGSNDSYVGATGNADSLRIKPQLTFDRIERSSYDPTVLAKVNGAADDTIEGILRLHANTIDIDAGLMTEKALPLIKAAIVGKSFASLADVKTAYNTAANDPTVTGINYIDISDKFDADIIASPGETTNIALWGRGSAVTGFRPSTFGANEITTLRGVTTKTGITYTGAKFKTTADAKLGGVADSVLLAAAGETFETELGQYNTYAVKIATHNANNAFAQVVVTYTDGSTETEILTNDNLYGNNVYAQAWGLNESGFGWTAYTGGGGTYYTPTIDNSTADEEGNVTVIDSTDKEGGVRGYEFRTEPQKKVKSLKITSNTSAHKLYVFAVTQELATDEHIAQVVNNENVPTTTDTITAENADYAINAADAAEELCAREAYTAFAADKASAEAKLAELKVLAEIAKRIKLGIADNTLMFNADFEVTGTQVKANLTMTNTKDNAQDYVLMFASYDADGMLLDVTVGEETQLASGTIQDKSKSISVDKTSDDASYKVFIWNKLSEMTPLYSEELKPVVAYKKGSTTEGAANISVSCLGDSITEQGTYIRGLTNLMMFNLQNVGKGGSRVAEYDDNYETLSFLERFEGINKAADIITVLGGVNDCIHLCTSATNKAKYFGNVTDMTDKTFCGGYNLLISGLIEKYPDSKIVVFTPIKTVYGSAPSYLGEYAEAIKQICSKHSNVTVIDLYNAHEVDFTAAGFEDCWKVPDILHPSEKGGEKIAEYMVKAMEKAGVITVAE